MTVEMFKAFWQNVSPELSFPGTKAGDDVSYGFWEDDDMMGSRWMYQGTRKAVRHGIVRQMVSSTCAWITEATYYDNKEHGLSFSWNDNSSDDSFSAFIFDHGKV